MFERPEKTNNGHSRFPKDKNKSPLNNTAKFVLT